MDGSSSSMTEHVEAPLRERRPRGRGHRLNSSAEPASLPDLAEVARAAVISFLSDEPAAAGGQGTPLMGSSDARAGGATAPVSTRQDDAREADWVIPVAAGTPQGTKAPSASQFAPQAVALRAAAISVATLERIEAAAATLEADIAAARAEQAEIQAGAGAAAEGAVRAAQAAWKAAGTAEEASSQAESSMRRIGRFMVATVVLVIIQVIFAVVFAASAH